MFGINPGEFVVLLIVAAVVLGPERLPQYAQQLGRLVRQLRQLAQGASEQVREELGPEFDDIDWRKLDPRQYDPRRIVRDALSDSMDVDDPLGLRQTFDDAGLKPRSAGGPADIDGAEGGTGGRRHPGPGRPARPAPRSPSFEDEPEDGRSAHGRPARDLSAEDLSAEDLSAEDLSAEDVRSGNDLPSPAPGLGFPLDPDAT